MEPLGREEIKDIFSEAIAPLIVEFRASHDSHEKEILRLTKQSTEHYEEIKELRDNMQKQVQRCQILNGDSQEKTGERIGELENIVTRIDEHVQQNKKEIEEMKMNKQFSISQWLVVAGVIAMIVLGVIPLLRG